MKKYNFAICCTLMATVILINVSCEKFLALKPDRKLAVPEGAADLWAMLNYVARMNTGYAIGLGEIASDNVFLPYDTWNAIAADEERLSYVWDKFPVAKSYWNPIYQKVLAANTILDQANQIALSESERVEIISTAKFFRAYAYFDLVQLFGRSYVENEKDTDLGIVLRLSSDINIESKRATLGETYSQIIADYEDASKGLPLYRPEFPTRPYRAAAYGALARCYMSMRMYDKAGQYADSCLLLQHDVLDYNTIPQGKAYPFEKYNKEVVFYSEMSGAGILMESRARVDTLLLEEYDGFDLRRALCFTKMKDGYYAFTGDYARSAAVNKFSGITTAEMLLVRAECNARNNKLEDAHRDLNHLLSRRYSEVNYVPVEGMERNTLLSRIILERRKELLFRGLRWIDLRRLSQEVELGVGIRRHLGEEKFILSRDEVSSFKFLIPQEVIDRSGIIQN